MAVTEYDQDTEPIINLDETEIYIATQLNRAFELRLADSYFRVALTRQKYEEAIEAGAREGTPSGLARLDDAFAFAQTLEKELRRSDLTFRVPVAHEYPRGQTRLDDCFFERTGDGKWWIGTLGDGYTTTCKKLPFHFESFTKVGEPEGEVLSNESWSVVRATASFRGVPCRLAETHRVHGNGDETSYEMEPINPEDAPRLQQAISELRAEQTLTSLQMLRPDLVTQIDGRESDKYRRFLAYDQMLSAIYAETHDNKERLPYYIYRSSSS